MADWTSGYRADIDYTFGYYSELNPLHARFALIASGIEPPAVMNACELGFGQGASLNFHAACSTKTVWYGTDFNPSQAGFAKSISEASKVKAHLYDQSFKEFCAREDLPNFDFIGLHGIWSWISDENRDILIEFLYRKLNVNGVVYMGYNTYPGWVTAAPLRQLLSQHSKSFTAPGIGVSAQIHEALDFTKKMFHTNPICLQANPLLEERFHSICSKDSNYLAHEYFNDEWKPVYFSEMARELHKAKLSFACSATYHDHIDDFNLTSSQRQFLDEIQDLEFRQSIRDFMVNQQFRKDYWV